MTTADGRSRTPLAQHLASLLENKADISIPVGLRGIQVIADPNPDASSPDGLRGSIGTESLSLPLDVRRIVLDQALEAGKLAQKCHERTLAALEKPENESLTPREIMELAEKVQKGLDEADIRRKNAVEARVARLRGHAAGRKFGL